MESTPTTVVTKVPRAVVEWLRDETIGGAILLVAAAAALIWANSPWSAEYFTLANTKIGPEALDLNLSLSKWAADGLLAVFFFVAGLELKYEFVRGSLRKFQTAVVPVAAALGGMIIPALFFLIVNLTSDIGEPSGWGIPMATDIAFALAVLAVAGRRLPIQVRIFLLTLAVVDDLGAITVIAAFYTDAVETIPLVIAALLLGLYAYLQKKRVRAWYIYLPLVLVIWEMVHRSGVHATVAGIALGLLTRAKLDPGEEESPAERLEHRVHPISAGFCVPLFAFFAAGVSIAGIDPVQALTEPLGLGIIVGLVVGKPIGVVGGAYLVTRFKNINLPDLLHWRDILAVGFVAGVGFTVSLLVAELAFDYDEVLLTDAKLAILFGSVLSAILASIALIRRGRHHDAISS
ncbi:MAG: Na+/H+ antiporter NhaA [Actinobacteria bacterium]|nr:Na+/H+ antiporter NhaA [Actinomycetota bacterium]